MTTQNTSLLSSAQGFYKNNPWKGRFILAFIIAAIVLGCVRIALPHTIIYSATSWLKQQGIDSSIEAINLNIIKGTVTLVNAKGNKNGKPLFNVGLIDIHWHWAPLSDKTVVVTKVTLDQLDIKIERYIDEITVGGVALPLAEKTIEPAAEEIKDEKIKPWAAALNEVAFTNLDICYLQHTKSRDISNDESKYVDYCVSLDEMSWNGIISYATDTELLKADDLPLSSTGSFSLNGLTITDNKLGRKLLVSASNTLKDVVVSGLKNIHVGTLEMAELSAFHRDDSAHKDSFHFQQLTFNDIRLIDLNMLSINTIDINEPGLYLVKNDGQNWEYQRWLAQKTTTDPVIKNTDKNTETKPASPFTISINNINIDKVDTCYVENHNDLNYCFIFDTLTWVGNINYDTSPSSSGEINLAITGSLKLSQPKVHNNILDRDLINFESLALHNIQLSGLNSITLDTINLNNFAALQRGTKQNDSTVSFDKLAIDDIIYAKNSITINTIKIDGLSDTVSKKSDGSWEHDKWLSKKENTLNADNEKKQVEENKQPFIISLNQLLVTSDKKLSFIDNSTKPAMNVALQSLLLDIKNIDSTKPDTDSPVQLSATTSQHSTIKITGTARPLAEKVSFNLNGALKGFDLRIASPATDKAMGHIIKSGQLDADLKLLATDGELDSNIGLSLYQFQIKAKTKADASKLDKTFGMPLNQTLVLLRDKDDSIHLDIPIIGDVNKPDFNPMDAIIKATSKAATVTLITFYTPYGLIFTGGNVLFDLATAMNFDPIIFQPGLATITENNKEKLENLHKLLTEKPGIHLTLCGVTNQQDAIAFYPPPITSENNKTKKDLALSNSQVLALNKLASERQENVKNYLITEKKIAHNRLILCEPEHQTGDNITAGVEINI